MDTHFVKVNLFSWISFLLSLSLLAPGFGSINAHAKSVALNTTMDSIENFETYGYRPCGSFQYSNGYPFECLSVLENLKFSRTNFFNSELQNKSNNQLDYICKPLAQSEIKLLDEVNELQKSKKFEDPKIVENLRKLYFGFTKLNDKISLASQIQIKCSIYYRELYGQKLFYPWDIQGKFHSIESRKELYIKEMKILSRMTQETKTDIEKSYLISLVRSVQTDWLIHFANVSYIEKSKKTFNQLIPGIAGVFALSGVMLMGETTFNIGFKVPRLGTLLAKLTFESNKGMAPVGDYTSEYDRNFPEPSSFFANTDLIEQVKAEESVADVHSNLLKNEIRGVMAGYATGFLSQIILESGPIGHAVHSLTENLVGGVMRGLQLGSSEAAILEAGEAVAAFHVIPTILSLIVAEEGINAFREFQKEKILETALNNWRLKAQLLKQYTQNLSDSKENDLVKNKKSLELYNMAIELYKETAAVSGIILFPAFDKMVEMRSHFFNIQNIPIRAQCLEYCLGKGSHQCRPRYDQHGKIFTAISPEDRFKFASEFRPFEHRINAALNMTKIYRDLIQSLFKNSIGLRSFFTNKIELFEKTFILTNGSLLQSSIYQNGSAYANKANNSEIAFDYINSLEMEIRSKAKLVLEKTHGGITRMPQAPELCQQLVEYF